MLQKPRLKITLSHGHFYRCLSAFCFSFAIAIIKHTVTCQAGVDFPHSNKSGGESIFPSESPPSAALLHWKRWKQYRITTMGCFSDTIRGGPPHHAGLRITQHAGGKKLAPPQPWKNGKKNATCRKTFNCIGTPSVGRTLQNTGTSSLWGGEG